MRAALYARVSTVGHGQDIGLQLDELRQVAAHRGWSAVEYWDDGISGAKASRPALDHLMADVRAGKIDVVACWRFDRFARSTLHLLSALEEFRTRGVEFLSLRENVDTSTPMGRVLFTIIAAVAELERDITQERVVAGVRRAQAAGKHCGRPRVVMGLLPARALLAQGLGLKTVARELGVSHVTLRRRLVEEGSWGPEGYREPPPETPLDAGT